MRIARKYSSEAVKESLIKALADGTYDNTAKLMLEEYAEQLATEFADYLLSGYIIVAPYFKRCWKSGKDAKTYSTNQLYEQFMIERSCRTQNNKCVIPDVSVSVCESPKDYICNVNDNGICGLPTSCVYKHTER